MAELVDPSVGRSRAVCTRTKVETGYSSTAFDTAYLFG
jgi:hypothetical protein